MSVLDGPRRERRRVLLDGASYWGTLVDHDSLRLDDGRMIDPTSLVHLAPCEVPPSKIIAIHLNFSSRSIEARNASKPGNSPTYFMKPTTSLNGHNSAILKPEGIKYLNYEGELALVIGKVARNVERKDAWSYISGFTPVLDMGAHDFRDTDQGSMLRVKGMDGFCPIGPGIVSGIDPRDQILRTYRNGRVVQEARIGDEMVWAPDYIVADLARYMTLLPGDIICTGTPAHSRSLDVGDAIEVEVTEIGRLKCVIGSIPAPLEQEAGHPPMDSEEARRIALGVDGRVREDLKANYREASDRP